MSLDRDADMGSSNVSPLLPRLHPKLEGLPYDPQ